MSQTVVGPFEMIGPFPMLVKLHCNSRSLFSNLAHFSCSGKGEFDGDSLEAFGGIRTVERGPRNATFISELVDGGVVRWMTLRPDNSGAVSVNFPNVRWQQLVNAIGTTVLEWQSWLVAFVHVERETAGQYQLHCSGGLRGCLSVLF